MGGIIDHDEIGSRGLFGHGHLRRKSRLCLYTRIPACAHHAMNLTFQWGCDCEYYIIIVLPVRLKKERDDGDVKGDGGGRGRGGGGRTSSARRLGGEGPEAGADEGEEDPDNEEVENLDPDAGKSEQQVIDEMTGQLSLFPDEPEDEKS